MNNIKTRTTPEVSTGNSIVESVTYVAGPSVPIHLPITVEKGERSTLPPAFIVIVCPPMLPIDDAIFVIFHQYISFLETPMDYIKRMRLTK